MTLSSCVYGSKYPLYNAYKGQNDVSRPQLTQDPFRIPNSESVIAFIREKGSDIVSGFSIDIQDLYYSIPQASLLYILRKTIEKQGVTAFQNAAGINLDSFLELLRVYLTATVVSHENLSYVQRSGLCIGSRVAPYLSDVFLAACGSAIQERLKDPRIEGIFRYVDDFLILCNTKVDEERDGRRDTVMRCFEQSCLGLKFTHELPVDNSIRFLDLALEFKSNHVCWRYQVRSCKGFLPFDSGHSKNVKRGVATTALISALKKTCHHQVDRSFKTRVSRLQEAGYPKPLLVAICEQLCRTIKRGLGCTNKSTKEKKKTRHAVVVAPYVHGVTHKLKKVAGRQGVQVVCSAPNKAYSMCRRVNQERSNNEKRCGPVHKSPYALCEKEEVYHIPLTCGRSYIGQTGRCINDGTREHAASVRTLSAGGHLPTHCRACQCSALFYNVSIVAGNKAKLGREILEALAIEEKGDDCVSAPSVVLHEKEKRFLRG